MATYAAPKKDQGPAMGGPEEPGAPNSSPSTAAVDGFWQAAQQMNPPAPGWGEISAPDGIDPSLGSRTPPMGSSMKVLGKLVRGVY
jgi:hypothetical protein